LLKEMNMFARCPTLLAATSPPCCRETAAARAAVRPGARVTARAGAWAGVRGWG
jgi:hypothetical protein